MAQLVVTPAIFGLITGGPDRLRAIDRNRCIEAVVMLGGLIVTAYIAGRTGASSRVLLEPRFYLPTLFLIWAAIRFGMFGASISVPVWALLFASGALEGRGPFAGQSGADTATALQAFLFPRALVVYLIALSIDQIRRAQDLLRESEQRFRNVADHAPVLIWMSGRDKLCDFFNQGWLDFTGRTMEAEMGDGWAEGVHPEDLHYCIQAYYSAFDTRASFEIEYRLRRRDGEYRWILDRGVPRYGADGGFVGYVGSAIDIEDRKRTEELSKSLAHVQRLAAIGELSASITHEIGQPLSAILLNTGSARRLLDSANPPLNQIRQIVSEIDQSLARANEVIRQTRAFLRRREMPMQPFDINSMIVDLLVLTGSEAARRSIQIRTDFPSELPPVLGDKTQLQQVLLNLMINGMDAMKDTPASERQLTLQCKLNDDRDIEFLVADRGCGIAADKFTRLFEPFVTAKLDGLGFGLSIARSIVGSHNGRIWAENHPTGGATFHFTVPAAEGEASHAREGA